MEGLERLTRDCSGSRDESRIRGAAEEERAVWRGKCRKPLTEF